MRPSLFSAVIYTIFLLNLHFFSSICFLLFCSTFLYNFYPVTRPASVTILYCPHPCRISLYWLSSSYPVVISFPPSLPLFLPYSLPPSLPYCILLLCFDFSPSLTRPAPNPHTFTNPPCPSESLRAARVVKAWTESADVRKEKLESKAEVKRLQALKVR